MNKNQGHEGLVEKSKDDNSNLPLTEGEDVHRSEFVAQVRITFMLENRSYLTKPEKAQKLACE